MSFELIVVIGILMLLLLLGSPVIFALGAASLSYFLIKPGMWANVYIYAHKFYTGMDVFVFLCIPLFFLTGEIMQASGLTDKLEEFAILCVGRVKGGLAYVNILDSMIFGGISGSAIADVAALGPIIIDLMKKDGYDPEFSTALVATTAIQGPIIPPSIPMIIFASVTNVSVGAMFLGGVIPGIMIGLFQAIVITFMLKKSGFPRHPLNVTLLQGFRIVINAMPVLILIGIIMVGIVGGVFTATEASAVAAGYALILAVSLYRKLSFRKFWGILINVSRMSAAIYLIVAFAMIASWVFAAERVPEMVQTFVNTHHFGPWTFFFFLNLFFLFNGCWISDTVQIVLFAPLFTPIMQSMGFQPIHFGVVMVVNVMIGLITPPYGMALYVASIVGKIPLEPLVRKAVPFVMSSIVILFLITFIPQLVLWIPSMFGFIK
jgi:tripartite ATP-independent transporter DctM subunit